ncbi:MAG: bifunctional 4-hydroxy-2-oxoglutarate aldolase/2-dehydro-3-deoxy-phosphogluconate aldolase [Chloroflexi bacterium]|nr:bifunctional 4-hydroxy-2-oxoglutarate aldolase/2-dehydro-3-deoxy-phosphogluconate aldolase [Chloroflexota bacterium]
MAQQQQERRDEALARIQREILMAVVRTDTAEQAAATARALVRGGITVIEITLTIPGAVEVMAALSAELPEALVGAGTVLTPEQTAAVLGAGARFAVSPAWTPGLIEACREAGAVSVPGALTPTEISHTAGAGADLVKVFPADAVGGPSYLRAVLAPLPHLRLVPSGGVKLDTMPAFLDAGAFALALGGDLTPNALVRAGDWDGITERARRYVQALEGRRTG